jgi:hypothetical protein
MFWRIEVRLSKNKENLVRIPFMTTSEQVEKINQWQAEHMVSNRAEAIRLLVELGLPHKPKKTVLRVTGMSPKILKRVEQVLDAEGLDFELDNE